MENNVYNGMLIPKGAVILANIRSVRFQYHLAPWIEMLQGEWLSTRACTRIRYPFTPNAFLLNQPEPESPISTRYLALVGGSFRCVATTLADLTRYSTQNLYRAVCCRQQPLDRHRICSSDLHNHQCLGRERANYCPRKNYDGRLWKVTQSQNIP
jgi:hypothetical protein